MNLNVLQKGGTVHTTPYPHIIIEDALPEDVYNELERTFPENAVLSTEPFDGGKRINCYKRRLNRKFGVIFVLIIQVRSMLTSVFNCSSLLFRNNYNVNLPLKKFVQEDGLNQNTIYTQTVN